MGIVKPGDWLYKESDSGKIRMWKAMVVNREGKVIYTTHSGYLHGTMTEHETQINASKKMLPIDRAVSKMESAYTRKRKAGYCNTVEKAKLYEPVTPMLLHNWDKHYAKIMYPAIIQPKLDGVCAIYRDSIRPGFYSRENNRFTQLDPYAAVISTYITDCIGAVKDQQVHLHGELYAHGHPVGDVIEFLKGKKEKSCNVQFYVFDYIYSKRADDPYIARLNWGIATFDDPPFEQITTHVVKSADEAEIYFDRCTESGYEGAVVSNTDGRYKWGKRTYDKLKIKKVFSDEFEIIEIRAEYHGETPLAIFRCKTKDGKPFGVRPMGDVEERASLYTIGPKLVGKKLTVEYRSKTKEGIPFHPVGIAVRDYE